MAEIRLQIPDDLVQSLQGKLGNSTKATDIAKDAISLYNWAVNERANGRVILSSNNEGTALKQVTMPGLDTVKLGS